MPHVSPSLIPPQRRSLVEQTADCLREGIRRGVWTNALPGERTLCEQLRVGRRTLRAALAELKLTNELRGGARRRAEILPFDGQDRHGARRPLRTVALLAPRPLSELSAATLLLVDTLRASLSEADYTVAWHVSRTCFTRKPSGALEALTTEQPAAVWVIVGSKEPMQRWFMKRRLPCLVIGSCGSDVTLPSVDVDYHAACRHAAGVLWRRGHRRLALVLPRDAFGGDVESEMGVAEGLTGLAGASAAVLRHDGSSSHLVRLMNARMANRETAPTAYFVAGADHAITVLTHLARMGKRVPRDVAVLCRDDEPMLRAVVPAMARYTFDRRAFARAVAGMVRRLAESAGISSESMRIQPLLIEGETIG